MTTTAGTTTAAPQQVRPTRSARRLVEEVRSWHRPLLSMVVAMVALVVVSAIGMAVDDRMLLGESVWLKPLKFGFAFALYGTTLAWLLTLPHKGNRWTRWMGTVFAVTGFVDVGFIAVQAARGTFSHFNSADDPVNAIGQIVFTSGVPGLFLANLVIAGILAWQKVADLPLTRAIHAGLALAVAGMALAYGMGSNGIQTHDDAAGQPVELQAGHTVGAPDGGPGMPVTHWSTTDGDLRVPHFVGLHGIQFMLVFAVILGALAARCAWLRSERTRAQLVGVVALGYAAMLSTLTWQAFREQPLIHPDGRTLTAFAVITVATAAGIAAVYLVARRRVSAAAPPHA
ncbi:hypothetical protein JGU71_02130 [Antrihabitans sp. YC3-6]|uniref:Uncharacterized protein n=1 Tax=Antrihabitans stalagmiti TaxID=2799499 RepID=A0A934NM49_9NOCA|nr:hypothetical protein [Antrihabitans stalagmiti]MBJ8337674.1 hypothetical protein [Antrihabitans stalagmiti]